MNDHDIKIDGTGLIQTSGYAHSAGETTFYLDPSRVYDSVAKVVYTEIVNSLDLPYSVILDDFQTDVETRVNQVVLIGGTLFGGISEEYNGQRDAQAISDFVQNDTNASGILTINISDDTSNPTSFPSSMVLDGGVGDASKINLSGNAFSFEKNHNIVCFDKKISGTLRIGYTTNAIVATVANSEYQKNIPIKATFIDSFIKHTHKIRAFDYFPLSYIHRLNIAEIWSIDDVQARYKQIGISKVDNYSGVETNIDTKYADSTGILMLHLGSYGYGQYALITTGSPTLYIRYYANKYDVSFDKIIIKEAEVTEC